MERNVKRKFDDEGQEMIDWTKLHDDTVIRLFSCLNNRDRASFSSACKPWWILSKSPFLWQSLDLRLYKCDAQAAKSLASRCDNLYKLRIRGVESAASVINLEANNLREISIEDCREISDVTLSVLVARHRALECLQIGPELCENITSDAIKAIALCCPNLKKLWLSGIKDVNGEAIHALAENCEKLIDVGFIDCGKVDETSLGNVRSLRFLSVAGTTNINWTLALLHWSNLLNLVCLDVSRTDVEASAVSELLLSCLSLKVLCAFDCPSLDNNPASINRRGKRLVAFFTDILEELATLFTDMPKEKGNVFLECRNLNSFKDCKVEGVLYWLEWTICNSLLCFLESDTSGPGNFWLHQGMKLLLSFLQSSHAQVQETAAKALADFDVDDGESVTIDVERADEVKDVIFSLLKLACSSQEGLQLEAVKAISNLSYNRKNAKYLVDEGGVDVLLSIARSARKMSVEEASLGLWNLSANLDHKTAFAMGGIRAIVEIIVKWANSEGTECIMEPAVGVLANLARDEECSMEIDSVSGVHALVRLLKTGIADGSQKQVARCLVNMTYHDSNWMYAAVEQETGALEALVQLVRSHHDGIRVEAAGALVNLSNEERHRKAIAAVGGVQALVALANSCANASSSPKLQEMAAEALWGLSCSEKNSTAIGEEGGVTALITLAKSDDEDVHESAAKALWELACNAENASRIIEEDGVPSLVHLSSSSASMMARFVSVLALAYMFNTRLDDLARVGTSVNTSKSARLETARSAAYNAINALLESYSSPQAYSAVTSSSLPTSDAFTRVMELALIQEENSLECSELHIGRLTSMLCHPSPILKSFGAFALLQFTIPGDEHALHHVNLLKKAGAPPVLRLIADSSSTRNEAKAFARVVLKNMEHHY